MQQISAKVFSKTLKTSLKSVLKDKEVYDTLRDNLKGVYFHSTEQGVSIVSTNGHILYKKDYLATPLSLPLSNSVVLSVDVVKQIIADIKEHKDILVNVSTTMNSITINGREYSILDTEYLDYTRGISPYEDLRDTYIFNKKELSSILKDNKKNVSKRSKLVKLDLDTNSAIGSSLIFENYRDSKPAITKKISISGSGNSLLIGLKLNLIENALSIFPTKNDTSITMYSDSNPIHQVHFRNEDTNELVLVMPMRIIG